MRLLEARSKQFAEFFDQIPPYAILSHTWGPNELTFKDVERNGYVPSQKIDGCCEQALKDGLNFAWVDTCCIDKSNSAELSEAINSMWDWYPPEPINVEEEDSRFSESRWFTRGWTLQELIAPKKVKFYDESWNFIGRKSASEDDQDFTMLLSRVTRIDVEILADRRSFGQFGVAQRMSWAARRTTTRVEDTAYSLLGLFGINMPLLYGEGSRAFQRLQEEIIKASDDESIFAWDFNETPRRHVALFAVSPRNFASCGHMVPSILAGFKHSHYTLTNKGLYI
ncbi:hypothetical protein BKA61DRAFT_647795 [Leptodontidium sp. MPI-SDFR-AT-0119]|nr:hypothetical protein BKA61DRAFT_647795 [Leptodontidium sp. MPI-SDFR-AT-0119]